MCERDINICHLCYACDEGKCPLGDDVEEIFRSMVEADGIIYAFPVHAFGVNSLMQVFLERAGVGYLRFKRPLEGKLASIIVTGRRYSHESAWGQVALNIMLNKMILTGSGFPATVKNDGKELKNTILDEEGLLAVRKSLDKMVELYTRLHLERSNQTEFETETRELDKNGYKRTGRRSLPEKKSR